MSMPKSPIGIVGLGPLQAAMARRLADEGTRVLVHDTRSEARASLGGARPRIEVAGSLADIGMECATVITTFDTPAALMAAIFGTEDRAGFARELSPGAVIVDMSPVSPRLHPRLQGALGPHALAVVDACVLSGGADEALSGTLTIALGGYPDFVERAHAVLAPLGRIERTGRLGSARTAAILTAALSARLQLAEREAVALGAAGGIDPTAMVMLQQLAQRGVAPLCSTDVTRLMSDIASAEALSAELGITSADVTAADTASLAG